MIIHWEYELAFCRNKEDFNDILLIFTMIFIIFKIQFKQLLINIYKNIVKNFLKQLIDLTWDDSTVYAIITALPDVIACIVNIPMMLRLGRKHFERIYSRQAAKTGISLEVVLMVNLLICSGTGIWGVTKGNQLNRYRFDNTYMQSSIIRSPRDHHIHVEISSDITTVDNWSQIKETQEAIYFLCVSMNVIVWFERKFPMIQASRAIMNVKQ